MHILHQQNRKMLKWNTLYRVHFTDKLYHIMLYRVHFTDTLYHIMLYRVHFTDKLYHIMLYRVHLMHVFLIHSNEVFAKKLHRNNHAKNGYITSTKQENVKMEYKNIQCNKRHRT
jgi:hypothetical protein